MADDMEQRPPESKSENLESRSRRLQAASLRARADSEALQRVSSRLLLEVPLRLITVINQEGVIQRVNFGWTLSLGYSRRDVPSESFLSFVHPDDHAGMRDAWKRVLDGERVVHFENRCRHKDGSLRWFIWQMRLAAEDSFFHVIGVDITERKELEAQQESVAALERSSRMQAEAAVRLREEFLATAAHELKTPLTTLKGYHQLMERVLREKALDEELFAEVVEVLGTQLGRLEDLVNDLLDVSRIHAGHLALRVEDVDLVELTREVFTRFEQSAELMRAHTLSLDASAPVVGRWDAARLDQVLSNLVSNALKYSPDGGAVSVRLRLLDESVLLEVTDEGIGISEADQARLFEPFRRGRGTRGISGTGLGLSIVHGIVVQHGGTIEVHSILGQGTRFTIRLPQASDMDPETSPYKSEFGPADSEA